MRLTPSHSFRSLGFRIFAGLILLPLAAVQAQSTYATPYTFTTLAGSAGNPGFTDSTGAAARFNAPAGAAVDGAGNVYVADSSNNAIRKITPAGVVTTFAGALDGSSGADDGNGNAARFFGPASVALDSSGNIYVADFGNHTIRKITPAGEVSTLAGSAGLIGSDDGAGTLARFWEPRGVAVDSAGNLYVADTGNVTIRKVTPAGEVTTFAGTAGIYGTDDGTGAAASFDTPYGVAVDSLDNIYVADTFNQAIRKITPAGEVSTLAGLPGFANAGTIDGTGNAARFDQPSAVAVDSSGNVYVADTNSHTIRKISAGGVVTTLAGLTDIDPPYLGIPGLSDGTGSAAQFNRPSGLAVGSLGNIYVAESMNHTIRMSKLAQATLSVSSSASGTFGSPYTATATGGSGGGALTWSLGTGSTAPGAAINATTGAVTSIGAGTVVINVTKAADANYLSATSADFEITLAKAAQATLSVSSSASGTFGTPYTATATGGSGGGALSWSLGTGSTAPGAAIDATTGAVTSSGAGTVVINVTKAADANYLSATSADFEITLAKAAQATLSVNSSASGTFGTPYTATATGGSGGGALSWSLGTGSTAPGAAIDSTTGAVTSSGAGTVVIKVTKAADVNYLPATSADFEITLAKAAQATLSVSSSASGTFGTPYTATATGGSGTGTLAWALGTGSTAAGAAIDTSTGAVSSSGAGAVVINVTKAADANYLSATSADFEITLAKAAQATLSVNSSVSGTFGSAYTATATGGSGGGALTWSLGTGSTAPGAAIDATTGAVTSSGAGTVVVKVTKATDSNYLAATSADFEITLAKAAQATLSVSSSASGTFGTPYTATATGGSGGGALTWSLGAGSTAPGAAINATTGAVTSSGAGKVVVKATKATDSNYLGATSADFEITLAKAAATVTLGSLSATYDGSSHAASATTAPASLAVAFTYDGSASAPTAAGMYAVIGTINDANYQGSASGSLTIAKATPIITWAAPSAIPYGTALSGTQLNASASAAGTFVYNPAAGAVLSTGAQTLNVTFTPTDTANYNGASAQQSLIVNLASGAPLFITQPVSQTVAASYSVTFTASASGVPMPTYQWRKNGVAIGGATGSSYTIASVVLADAGSYTVVATNSVDAATSNVAVLTTFTAAPSDAVISFTVE